MGPDILELSASQEDGVIPEIETSKTSQPDPVSSEKKFNRLSLSKGKKEAHKVEKTQSGHEHKQKDQPKKIVRDHSHIREQQKGEESGFGEFIHGLENLLGIETGKGKVVTVNSAKTVISLSRLFVKVMLQGRQKEFIHFLIQSYNP